MHRCTGDVCFMDAFRHNDVNGFVEKNAEDEAYSGRVSQYSDSGLNH